MLFGLKILCEDSFSSFYEFGSIRKKIEEKLSLKFLLFNLVWDKVVFQKKLADNIFINFKLKKVSQGKKKKKKTYFKFSTKYKKMR